MQHKDVAHLYEVAGAAVRSIVKLVEALRQVESELNLKRSGSPLASSPKRSRRSEQDEERPSGSPVGSHESELDSLLPEAPSDSSEVQPLLDLDKAVASEAAQALLDLGETPNEPVEQPDNASAPNEAEQADGASGAAPDAFGAAEQPDDALDALDEAAQVEQPDEQPNDALDEAEQPDKQPDEQSNDERDEQPDEQPNDALDEAEQPDKQPDEQSNDERDEQPDEQSNNERDEQPDALVPLAALSETADEPLDASEPEPEPAVNTQRPAEGPPLVPGEYVALREAQHDEAQHDEAQHDEAQHNYTVARIESYDAEGDEASVAMYELVDAQERVHELIGTARVQGFRAAVIPSWLVVQQRGGERVCVIKAGELDPIVQGRFVAVRGNDTPDQCRDQIWLYETTSSKPYLRRGQLLQRCSEHFYDGPGSYELIPVHSAICPYSVLDWDVPLKVHSDGTYCLRTKTYEGLRYQLKTSLRTHK